MGDSLRSPPDLLVTEELKQTFLWVNKLKLWSAWVLSCFSHVQLFATLWTVAPQGLLSMRFSRREYWRGLLFPPPGDLPDPGIQPTSLISPALTGGFFITSTNWEVHIHMHKYIHIFVFKFYNNLGQKVKQAMFLCQSFSYKKTEALWGKIAAPRTMHLCI